MVKAPKSSSPKSPKSLKAVKSPKVKTPKTPKMKSPKSLKEKGQKTPKLKTPKTKSPDVINPPVKSPGLEKKKKSLQKELDILAASITESPKSVPVKQIKKGRKSGKIGKGAVKKAKKIPVLREESDDKDTVELAPLPRTTFATDLLSIVSNATKGLAELLEISKKKKSTSLFKDLPARIAMSVSCFKQPRFDVFLSIKLPYSLYSDEDDFVLVINNRLVDDDDEDDEELKANLFKQKLLVDHGIKLREVYTIKTLRRELGTYEAKRAFNKRVDGILVDRSVMKQIPGILGREMYRKKTSLLPVNFSVKHRAEEIRNAMKRTVFRITKRGKSSWVQFGTDDLSCDQLLGNLIKICENLRKSYPGGWPNIEILSLEAFDLNLPIHIATGEAEITKPMPKTKKLREVVEGEISTQLNKKVTIYPDGNIKVEKAEKDDGESDVEIPEDDEIANNDDVDAVEDEEMDSD